MTVLAAALAVALAAAGATPAQGPSRGSRATSPGRPAPPTHVQAATADYLYKDRRTILIGAPLVTFTREDATLVCRKAVAFNDAQGEIERATCEGDVKLTRGERIVTCARATFEASTGKVICRGDPILRDGATVLHCDEVVYDLDQDKVSASQVRGTIVQKQGEKPPVRGRTP